MHRYAHILAEVLGLPWAITQEYRAIIAMVLARRLSGDRVIDDASAAQVAAGQARAAARGAGQRIGAVAVMPILGVLLPRGEAMQEASGAMSVQQLTAQFDQLIADASVAAVVLDVDSPGGSVGGVAEFADRVHAARDTKPVVAIANTMMASAAYWVGSAAAELIVSPSSLTGSLGVYTMHEDLSEALAKAGVKVELIAYGKNKTLGNPFEPLSEDGRAELTKRVNTFGEMFTKAVARGRSVSQKTAREDFGQGAIFGAEEAVKVGLADRIGTLDDAVALAAKRAGVKVAGARAELQAAASDDERARFRLALAERGM